jgi:hypothetical protein
MEATHLFHALTRGALCAKKWLADRGHRTTASVDDGVRAAFERESSALCYASDAVAWTKDLARIAAPPRGRVTELVSSSPSPPTTRASWCSVATAVSVATKPAESAR